MEVRTTKQLFGIIGVLVFFCVGLSGCSSIDLVTIAQIREHPEYYQNQTVMIQAMYSVTSIMDESGNMIPILIPEDVIKPTPLSPGKTYTFTGVVIYGKIAPDGNDLLYLAVKKIDTTTATQEVV